MDASGLELLLNVFRPSNAAWLVGLMALSTGLAALGTYRKPAGQKVGEFLLIAAILMIAGITVTVVWNQAMGAYVPFWQGWPAALVTAAAFAGVFVLYVNLKERISLVFSVIAGVFFTAVASVFFALAFFLMPSVLGAGWQFWAG